MWQFNGILVTHDTLERICPNRTDRTLIRLEVQNSNIFSPYFHVSFYLLTAHPSHLQGTFQHCKSNNSALSGYILCQRDLWVSDPWRDQADFALGGQSITDLWILRHELPSGHVTSSTDGNNSFPAEMKGGRWTVSSRSCLQGDTPRARSRRKWLSR